jgi:predicted small secreted protein
MMMRTFWMILTFAITAFTLVGCHAGGGVEVGH